MSVPFPNYFEFASINPAYQLDPETKGHLVSSWKYLTNYNTIVKKSPEGLLIPNGVNGIQQRMEEVRYLAVVPKELAEEIRLILVVHLERANIRRANRLHGEERTRTDGFRMEDCPPNMGERRRDEREEDPFPELPCPWPWELGDFTDSERPLSGRLHYPYSRGIRHRGTRIINYIFTYDYCGQYFGSAKDFCSYMSRTNSSNNYSDTLERLKDHIEINGDAPLIVLCPENIITSLSRLNVPGNLYSGTPPTSEEQYIFGLKKVLIHEMGHHMFPVVTNSSDDITVYWPECMANWFAYHLLDMNERFLLHIWSLGQPVQYQCYKALLGLSMRDDVHEFLSIISSDLRSDIIVEAEKVCSYNNVLDSFSHIGFRGRFFIDPFLVMELDELSSAIHQDPMNHVIGHSILLTHSEALFQLLIDENQYRDFFATFQHMISRGIIDVHRASKGEYHRMLLDEGKLKPMSLGCTR